MVSTTVKLKTPFKTKQKYLLKHTTTGQEVHAEFALDEATGDLLVSTERPGHYNLHVANYTGEYMYRLLIGEELNSGSLSYYLEGFQGGSGGISEERVQEIVENYTSDLLSEDLVRDIVSEEVEKLPPAVVEDEEILRVIGYKTIISEEEPEEYAHVLSDGTIIPIVWYKPIEKYIPVVPDAPFWDTLKGTVLVSDITGMEYRITGINKGGEVFEEDILIPEEETFNFKDVLVHSPPYNIRVEASAHPGYYLVNDYAWAVTVPDMDIITTWTSETFSGLDDGVSPTTWMTDAALGGSPASARVTTKEGSAVIEGDSIRTLTSDEYTEKGITGDRPRIEIRNVPDYIILDFDYEYIGQYGAGAGAGFNIKVSSGEFWFQSNDILSTYVNTSNQSIRTRVYSGPAPSGHYTLEVAPESMSISVPGQERFTTSVVNRRPMTTSSSVLFSVAGNSKTLSVNLRNIVIREMGAV